MAYLVFQNDELLSDADNLKEAECTARAWMKRTKLLNKGRILRPSQYIYIYKFVKEYTK